MIGYLSLIGSLIELSVEDGKECRIRNTSLLAYSLLGIVTAALRVMLLKQSVSVFDGIMLSVLLLFMSCIMKQGIGTGDLWVLAGLPLFIDGDGIWESVMISMMLIALVGGIVYWKERSKTAEIPYVPFLCAGVFLMMWRRIIHG